MEEKHIRGKVIGALLLCRQSDNTIYSNKKEWPNVYFIIQLFIWCVGEKLASKKIILIICCTAHNIL